MITWLQFIRIPNLKKGYNATEPALLTIVNIAIRSMFAEWHLAVISLVEKNISSMQSMVVLRWAIFSMHPSGQALDDWIRPDALLASEPRTHPAFTGHSRMTG